MLKRCSFIDTKSYLFYHQMYVTEEKGKAKWSRDWRNNQIYEERAQWNWNSEYASVTSS